VLAFRCLFLARSYAAAKRFAEALALHRSAGLHQREARSALSTLADPAAGPAFLPLDEPRLAALDGELDSDAHAAKRVWFTFNGGVPDADAERARAHKKPLFFDIALNYVTLNMPALEARAGRAAAPVPAKPTAAVAQAEKLKAPRAAKVEEDVRAATPEPEAASARGGGLGSLLGGWWGRK
jgi:signal recognition particle subunit SRP68